jgi:redox-sensitive bicupin YhaK (pirin superfamily)
LIDYRPIQGLGCTRLSGLVGRHHFCFARYQHPERLEWGRLRIWNDYQLEPGPGRPPEHCDNFDIVTIVRGGILQRPGSFGDMCVAGAGEAQILTTGSGASIGLRAIGRTASFYEIWLSSDERYADPRCASMPLPSGDGWNLLASGFDRDKKARLTSAARVHLGRMPKRGKLRKRLEHPGRAYVVPISGAVRLGDLMMTEGSGAAILGETEITFEAPAGGEVILVECGVDRVGG